MNDYQKPGVIFVDDDPRILSGLRMSLRRLRNDWDIEFVASGSEALSRFRDRIYDIIVTDIRMPDMDGISLLRSIQKEYPAVIRILFSGQSKLKDVFQSVTLAHQYFAKPSSRGFIENRLSRLKGWFELDLSTAEKVALLENAQISSWKGLDWWKSLEACDKIDLPEKLWNELDYAPFLFFKYLQIFSNQYFGSIGPLNKPTDVVNHLDASSIKKINEQLVFHDRTAASENAEIWSSFTNANLTLAHLCSFIAQEAGLNSSRCAEAYFAGLMYSIGLTGFPWPGDPEINQKIDPPDEEIKKKSDKYRTALCISHGIREGICDILTADDPTDNPTLAIMRGVLNDALLFMTENKLIPDMLLAFFSPGRTTYTCLISADRQAVILEQYENWRLNAQDTHC